MNSHDKEWLKSSEINENIFNCNLNLILKKVTILQILIYWTDKVKSMPSQASLMFPTFQPISKRGYQLVNFWSPLDTQLCFKSNQATFFK